MKLSNRHQGPGLTVPVSVSNCDQMLHLSSICLQYKNVHLTRTSAFVQMPGKLQ